MADVNWRAIRAIDCDFSDRLRAAIAQDHGSAVTLGDLAGKSDVELVRSPNIGRRSINEIRLMIAKLQTHYPETPKPLIFVPNGTIEWALLGQAIAYYKAVGYSYIDAPWVVDDETIAITAKHEEWRAPGRMGLGTLVGSAEQSFLYLRARGLLEPGRRYVACTPCFRPAEDVDDLHAPYFMKIELISFHADAPQGEEIAAQMMEGVAQVAFGAQLQAMITFLGDAGGCFRELGATPEMLSTEQTDEGVDILVNGIEVGSYGMRRHQYADGSEVAWTYGTGLALPRFSQALIADDSE